jgi:hypothetical protein
MVRFVRVFKSRDNVPETLAFDAARLCGIRAQVEHLPNIAALIEGFLDGEDGASFPQQELLMSISKLHLVVHGDTLRIHVLRA